VEELNKSISRKSQKLTQNNKQNKKGGFAGDFTLWG